MKPHRTYAEIHLNKLKNNLDRLARVGAAAYDDWKGAVVMVKCDAYGHGMIPVSRVYERHRDALAFGVATVDEGITLRKARLKKPIWVFSDGIPLTEEVLKAMVKYRLTPVFHRIEDLKLLRNTHRLSFHLKINTGLNRLGIDLSELSQAHQWLRQQGLRPEGICSHLSASEDPSAPITAVQIKRFLAGIEQTAEMNPRYIHCANSNGLLEERALSLGRVCNVARPGIGLYGYGGKKAAALGLVPALTWHVQVVRDRKLHRGDCVGYGATFRAKSDVAEGVVAVGYGDGLRRSLSNQDIIVGFGVGVGAGARRKLRRVKVLGRVSMDLCALNLRLNSGDWVTLLGEGHRQGEIMAQNAGTIIYEILTSISPRVPRIY